MRRKNMIVRHDEHSCSWDYEMRMGVKIVVFSELLRKGQFASGRYLPAYSPDLSPIEPAWAKVKSYLRRVAARTVEALEQALAPAFDSITAQDAASFFRHCGYACPS